MLGIWRHGNIFVYIICLIVTATSAPWTNQHGIRNCRFRICFGVLTQRKSWYLVSNRETFFDAAYEFQYREYELYLFVLMVTSRDPRCWMALREIFSKWFDFRKLEVSEVNFFPGVESLDWRAWGADVEIHEVDGCFLTWPKHISNSFNTWNSRPLPRKANPTYIQQSMWNRPHILEQRASKHLKWYVLVGGRQFDAFCIVSEVRSHGVTTLLLWPQNCVSTSCSCPFGPWCCLRQKTSKWQWRRIFTNHDSFQQLLYTKVNQGPAFTGVHSWQRSCWIADYGRF